MAWSKLTDMAMTPEEMADNAMPCGDSGAPEYPWGLRGCFTDAELAKLGLNIRDASIGDLLDMRVFATVTSISENRKADGTSCCRVEWQIEKIAVEDEMREDGDDKPAKPARKSLYAD